MKILVISGGNTSEREISLISGRAVEKALIENGHLVEFFDLKKGLINLEKIVKDFDVIFPVVHGEKGEGGELQKFLSDQKKPFVGGDWKGFKKGWHKIPFKKFCDQMKIKTAKWKVVKNDQAILKFGFPSVLKSSSGGSSQEVVILLSEKYIKSKECQKLLKSNQKLFIEKFIYGVEVTVAILGDKALPVIEIVPPKGGWFDYKNKYSGATKAIPNAPSLIDEEKRRVEGIALEIHKLLNLGHYSRIDFIFSKGIFYVLESNTVPGLTPQSLFPKAAQEVGLNFNQLAEKLIDLAQKYDYSS